MTEKISPAHPRLLHMDFLRGIAILYIVAVRHLDDYAGNFYHNKIDDVITESLLGLFMFISGYLLSMNSPINNRGDLFRFISNRFLRIYPLYVLAVFLFMLCSLMSFKSLLLHMSLLNILLNNDVITLWFVSIICIFYISYPIIAYRYSALKTVIIFILFCIFIVLINRIFGLFDKRLLKYYPIFILGIVSLKHDLIERFFYNRIIVIWSILVFSISSYLYFRPLILNQMFSILIMASAIPSLLLIGKSFSTIMNKSVYIKIAYASFCMYLFHRVIFTLMTQIYCPNNNFYIVIYLTILGVPIIFATSFYLQKYYDQLTFTWRKT
jgi:peptidoglycan/LPS O-acetylase OafA/YrhL